MTIGNIAGMLITTPVGGLIDSINIVMDDSDLAIGMVAARGWKGRHVLPW